MIKLPYTDFKPYIKSYITKLCQCRWNEQQNNKLFQIQPCINYLSMSQYARHEAVVLRRCRIGHTFLTHAHLLKAEEAPQCIPCNTPLTVKHILTECIDFTPVRDRFYSVSSMQQLFSTISGHLILEFLKEINIYNKI